MAEYCDRIGVMLAGRLIEQGPASRIYRAPQHEYTRRLWASFPRLPGSRPAFVEAEALP